MKPHERVRAARVVTRLLRIRDASRDIWRRNSAQRWSVERVARLSRHRYDVSARAFGPAGRVALASLEFPARGAAAAQRTPPPERSLKLGALTQRRPNPSLRIGGAPLHGFLVERFNDVKSVASDLQSRHSRIYRSLRQIDAELHQHPFGDCGGAKTREPKCGEPVILLSIAPQLPLDLWDSIGARARRRSLADPRRPKAAEDRLDVECRLPR